MSESLIIFVVLGLPVLFVALLLLGSASKNKDRQQVVENNPKRVIQTPEKVVQNYLDAGLEFGSAVSDLAMGQCLGFENLHGAWSYWEKEYAQLGYQTISIDAFESCAGWGHSIDDLVKQKRDDNEEVILHAELYRIFFLNRIGPAIDTKKLMTDGEQFGTYFVPSTAGLVEALTSMREREPSFHGLSIMQVAEALRARKEEKQEKTL